MIPGDVQHLAAQRLVRDARGAGPEALGLTEAVSTATVLQRVTGDSRHADDAARWWASADRHLVDREHGSWHHVRP